MALASAVLIPTFPPPASQRSRHALFGNVPVNGLNEWSVYKLGWLKHDRASRKRRDGSWEVVLISRSMVFY